jgi:glucosyl-dolichyl phosphate glucuronosyltransferase
MQGVTRFATAVPAAAAQFDKRDFLTVVICTHDRPAYLQSCLESLAAQGPKRCRCVVLVVDSASTPASALEIVALAAAHGANYVRLDHPGLSVARNAGLAAARTPWVAYIDDDARVKRGWMCAIADAVGRLPSDTGAIGGSIAPDWEAPCPVWWPPELVPALTVLEWDQPGRVGDGSLPPNVEPYGANMVFRREALRGVGGFPPQLGRIGSKLLSGEEMWVMRVLRQAGWNIRYEPGVAVCHSIQAGRLTPSWLMSRQYWSGVSEAMVVHRLGRRNGAVGKALRMALHATLRSPLAAWPTGSAKLIRQRCALAFASGYLRGLAAAMLGA